MHRNARKMKYMKQTSMSL